MLTFTQSEATAARRRVPLHLVDATDGITPETAEAAGQPQLSKNGAAFANTTATLTAIGNGAYYVELTAAELDTAGFIVVRYKSAATAEAQTAACVTVAQAENVFSRIGAPTGASIAADLAVIDDFLDTEIAAIKTKTDFLPSATAGSAGGVFIAGTNAATTITTALTTTFTGNLTGSVNSVTTGVTLAASAVQAIWDALTSAFTTVGSIGKLIVDNLNATISSRMASYTQPAGFLAATFPTGTVANTTNITAGTITTATNLTNLPAIPDNWLTAAGIAADAITAAKLAADASTEIAAAVNTVALVESYRANGAQGTLTQLLYEILAHLTEASIAGTTKTIKKIDHTTVAATATLDNATAPTSITRAT